MLASQFDQSLLVALVFAVDADVPIGGFLILPPVPPEPLELSAFASVQTQVLLSLLQLPPVGAQ